MDKYILKDILQNGRFSSVYLSICKKTYNIFAIKKICVADIYDLELQCETKNEIKMLKNLTHPNIIRLEEVITSPEYIYIVMEYISNGDLCEYIQKRPEGKLSEQEAKYYFIQLLEALTYIHSKNISHRDIKLENLLLTKDNKIKLSDFGFSIRTTKMLHKKCGTPYYTAPEIFDISNLGYYGPKIDIWSSGVVLYVMLNGYFPFKGNTFGEITYSVKHNKYYNMINNLSTSFENLISKMLIKQVLSRINLKNILEHEWITNKPIKRNNSNLSHISESYIAECIDEPITPRTRRHSLYPT